MRQFQNTKERDLESFIQITFLSSTRQHYSYRQCHVIEMSLFPDAPNVELLLGKSISAESIYEGGDVYFDCRVHSSPPPDRVNWYHNVSLE